MVTELEQALWAAAPPIRATRFARILRNARMADRDPSLPGPDDETQGWELSFDPAIQRTLGAVTAIGIMRNATPVTKSEWFEWNLKAKKAVARLAAKCWAGIDSQRRAVFVDEDNFNPVWGQTNMHDLRSDSSGPHLAFEGLNDSDVRAALRAVYQAARATPAYEDVLRADRQLGRSPDMLILWARLSEKGHRDIEAALKDLPIGDGRERGIEIVGRTYSGTPVEVISTAFRRYNRLVQHIVWSILGLAEMTPGPLALSDTIGTVRCTHAEDGSPFIRLASTAASLPLLRITYPVWLQTGTPLDGLHLLIGSTMTIGPGAASDLSLTPIRWSAGCWPRQSLV